MPSTGATTPVIVSPQPLSACSVPSGATMVLHAAWLVALTVAAITCPCRTSKVNQSSSPVTKG